MEGISKNKNEEKPISPEDFFANKVEIYKVTKDNFTKLVKERNLSKDDDRISQAVGVNFELNGKVVILLRTDIFPEEYMPYLEAHEKWEAYISRKNGFNLWDRSIREYKNDKGIENFNEKNKEKFYEDINLYNYDFRHEYAIYKEYEQAMKDGKLDEYHNWFMDYSDKQKLNAKKEDSLKLRENDTEIRKSVYEKLKNNTPHVFLKK